MPGLSGPPPGSAAAAAAAGPSSAGWPSAAPPAGAGLPWLPAAGLVAGGATTPRRRGTVRARAPCAAAARSSISSWLTCRGKHGRAGWGKPACSVQGACCEVHSGSIEARNRAEHCSATALTGPAACPMFLHALPHHAGLAEMAQAAQCRRAKAQPVGGGKVDSLSEIDAHAAVVEHAGECQGQKAVSQ